MRKLFNKIKDKANTAVFRAKSFIEDKRAEGYVDSGVKILIAVVIGALLLTLIYSLIKNEVFTVVSQKIRDLFSYDGTP